MSNKITAAIKDQLVAVFVKLNWGYNRNLGKAGKLEAEIAELIRDHHPRLSRAKVVYQLKEWKKKKYKHADACLHGTEEEIRQQFESQLVMSAEEFSLYIIRAMLPNTTEHEDRNAHEQQYLLQYTACTEDGEKHIEAILEDGPLLRVFEKIVNNYITIGCECFPKMQAMASSADTKFQTMRLSSIHDTFFPEFLDRSRVSDVLVELSDSSMRTLVMLVEENLFRFWAIMAHEHSELPIEISQNTDRINKYSLPVLYYTASWIVAGLVAAKRAKATDKLVYTSFGLMHSLTKAESIRQNLPTATFDRRDPHSKQHRASMAFFQFIARIEATYLTNLSVDMMLSYSRGDLLSKIRGAIEADTSFRVELISLFGDDDSLLNDTSVGMIKRYILVKFVHMRGRWFERAVHGCGKYRQNVVASLPTRSKVVVSSMLASAKSKAKRADDAMYLAAQVNLGEADLPPADTEGVDYHDGDVDNVDRQTGMLLTDDD